MGNKLFWTTIVILTTILVGIIYTQLLQSDTSSTYSVSQVSTHSAIDDCWVTLEGNVYAIPLEWTEVHPGGQEVFKELCGSNITEVFGAHVTDLPAQQIPQYLIGILQQ